MGIFISLIVYPNHGAGCIVDGERILRNLTIYVHSHGTGSVHVDFFWRFYSAGLSLVGHSTAYVADL